jgi:hypothetical protein
MKRRNQLAPFFSNWTLYPPNFPVFGNLKEVGECDPWIIRSPLILALWGWHNYSTEGMPVVAMYSFMKDRYRLLWDIHSQTIWNPGKQFNEKCFTQQDAIDRTRCLLFLPFRCRYVTVEPCPVTHQSISGCADFIKLGRYSLSIGIGQTGIFTVGLPQEYAKGLQCEHASFESSTCSDWEMRDSYGKGTWTLFHKAATPVHYSVQIPINYSDAGLPFYQDGVPPTVAPHRYLWPKWGRYSFLPEARWLHHIEHGGIAMLYHPCLNALDTCMIEHLATNFNLSRVSSELHGGTRFRWVLTPYPQLKTKFAMAANNALLMEDCLIPTDISQFIIDNYGCRDDNCESTMDLTKIVNEGFAIYDALWLDPQYTKCKLPSPQLSASMASHHMLPWSSPLFGVLCLLWISRQRAHSTKSF